MTNIVTNPNRQQMKSKLSLFSSSTSLNGLRDWVHLITMFPPCYIQGKALGGPGRAN